jgi:hypothetical protein
VWERKPKSSEEASQHAGDHLKAKKQTWMTTASHRYPCRQEERGRWLPWDQYGAKIVGIRGTWLETAHRRGNRGVSGASCWGILHLSVRWLIGGTVLSSAARTYFVRTNSALLVPTSAKVLLMATGSVYYLTPGAYQPLFNQILYKNIMSYYV